MKQLTNVRSGRVNEICPVTNSWKPQCASTVKNINRSVNPDKRFPSNDF